LGTRGLALALWGLGAVAAAGDKKAALPTFSAGAEVVNLTVTVRDLHGQLVSDLSPDDFVVFEDGRPQAVQLFAPAVKPGQEEALALDLGLLLDTSESMAKEIKLTQEAATRFLEAIPRARDLLTIFFDQDIRISRYDSEHQQGLFERILDARATGNTALYDAIAVYLSRVQDSGGRKVLVILTDGEDTTSALSLSEVMDLVRSSPVTIYPIAFSGDYLLGTNRAVSARSFLRFLAEMTGGSVFTPSASKDLSAIYEKILDELSAQYVLGFTSDNLKRDGKIRKLRVDVKRKDLKVRHRLSYYGPRDR
jgi:Ca-activated chloride channel family protein